VVRGSASIGVALYPDDADSADSLLKTADAAMYVVKQSRSHGRTAVSDAMASNPESRKCA
jgi:GGDEF domain-containing protein